jgi:hypothetical protein
MRDKQVNKYFTTDASIPSKYKVFGVPSDKDYSLLKDKYMPGEIEKDKIFVYSVKACDNKIDRSGEMFSNEALEDIAKLMVGKPTLDNHERDVEGQKSIIYKAEVVKDDTQKNDFNEPYEYVVAYCYMLNNERNKFLIDDILGGIRKGASVGCHTIKAYCNICGKDLTTGECVHNQGQEYLDMHGVKKTCVVVLDRIDDFYELSFVAVPCQREAGIIKKYDNKEVHNTMEFDVKKSLLELASKGVDSDTVNKLVKAFEDSGKTESDVVKGLKAEINSLKADVEAKGNKIKAYEEAEKAKAKEDAVAVALDGLEPVNDNARDIALKLIESNITEKEDGTLEVADDLHDTLIKDYSFLFKPVEDSEDEDEEEEVVEEEEMKEDEDPDKTDKETEEDKKDEVEKSVKKSLDFTKKESITTKSTSNDYSSMYRNEKIAKLFNTKK